MEKKTISEKYKRLSGHLDEKGRRLWCANEALTLGRGGIVIVHDETGVARGTIIEGMKELRGEKILAESGVRRKGGGRKQQTEKDERLLPDIERIVEEATRGDPEKPLKWRSKSTAHVAEALNQEAHRASDRLVARTLEELGYSRQANKKVAEGADHPDRDEQFSFINAKVKDFQKCGQPVISLDTKKKELVGNYRNSGREYHRKGQAPQVNVYDFLDKEKGKASPYGVYDLDKNKGWVSVGLSSDTAEFAVNLIRRWWQAIGQAPYKAASQLYINADGGGSNGSRNRLWKKALQQLANEIGKAIHVSHFPPATSQWNKIEHRMFCLISPNWRAKPLLDTATIVSLIGNTKTKTGLEIKAMLDERSYQTGIKVSDEELAALHIEKEAFHGEWNYSSKPIVQVILS